MSTYTAVNFYDVSVWRSIMLCGILLSSLIVANIIKRRVPFFKESLIPNSVLGGIILLVISGTLHFFSGTHLVNLEVFSRESLGINTLEILTYHCLALGFIAMTLRPSGKGTGRGKRGQDILNSGVTTIGGYVIQAIVGIIITILSSKYLEDLASGSGVLLCFGYGQGTGQALNIGKNFDATLGTSCYSSFGLAIAALGFLTASIVGVIYLNFLRKKGKISQKQEVKAEKIHFEQIQAEDEIPMNESIDKITIQIALVGLAYLMAYGMMYLLGNVLLGEESSLIGTIYGFNFIFGVLSAVIIKGVMNFLKRKGIIHREYLNSFLLNRISGFAFDLMIVCGICAIQLDVIQDYAGVIMILGVAGAIVTFVYLRIVCPRLFPEYEHEQFLAWFGMLTGTASTGMILLREADPELKTPVSENLVYQNFPAIVLGAPVLLIAGKLTSDALIFKTTVSMLILLIVIFIVLNIFLFRSCIFKGKKEKSK